MSKITYTRVPSYVYPHTQTLLLCLARWPALSRCHCHSRVTCSSVRVDACRSVSVTEDLAACSLCILCSLSPLCPFYFLHTPCCILTLIVFSLITPVPPHSTRVITTRRVPRPPRLSPPEPRIEIRTRTALIASTLSNCTTETLLAYRAKRTDADGR